MQGKPSLLALTAGALLLAAFFFGLASAPGFLSDADSVTTGHAAQRGAAR